MRISVVILIIFSLGLGCGRELPPANNILLIGHGGEGFNNLSALYAPNSVGSMKRALDFYQLDGIEVDVRFTADSNLIVYHDAHLEVKTQCKGRVSEILYEDVQGCYYRKQFKNVYSEQIISLDSFITLLNTVWTTQSVSIQVHSEVEDNREVDKLAKLYARKIEGIQDKSRLHTESNNANFLFYLRRVGAYQCHLIAILDSFGVNDVYRFGVQGIVARFDVRDATLEKRLKDSGKYISLYGQKITRDFSKYTYQYIDAVQVDNPIQAIKFYKNQ